MSDTLLSEYIDGLSGRIRERRRGNMDPGDDGIPLTSTETAFTDVVLEKLEEIGQLPGLERAHFEKRVGRANCKLNAYGFSENDSRIELVVTVGARDDTGLTASVPGSEIATAARQALQAFRASRGQLHLEMEPSSPTFDMMEFLHGAHELLQRVRVIVLVCGKAARVPESTDIDQSGGVELDIWDIERLHRADSSGLPYESIRIDLRDFVEEPVACIAALAGGDDHRCYLAVLSGELLHDLYQRYGSRLLELNVRSFLQARGKVNRGIRDTLLNDPQHFLAYNNGISITVEDMELAPRADGSEGIVAFTGLQIVNGGQTVASIHRAKQRDRASLGEVFVQAKITVVDPQHVENLVPFISRFANTQNRVSETDFSANHPFHVELQKLSEKVWAPGETSRWFYERARGQWEVARAREGTTPARVRAFDAKLPRKQRIDKTIVARAENAWSEKPHVVSLGGQKNFVRFMESLHEHRDLAEPDESYYRQLIAKVILLKTAEAVARRIGFSAYRANAVCYTVSLLAYRTAGRIDLAQIWSDQQVSDALHGTLVNWMPAVHAAIVQSAAGRNVTEWCKKAECWSHVQALDVEFSREFEGELAEGLPVPNVGSFKEHRGAAARSLSAEERQRQAVTMRLGPDDWQAIMRWGRESGELNEFQMSLAGTILGYAAGGWLKIPSPKQTRHSVKVIEAWRAEAHQNEAVDELD